jgi:predicted nucleic acid-binding protein
MPGDRAFFDTNILVYAFSTEGGAQQVIAFGLLSDGGTVGVQTLNEYANVAYRHAKEIVAGCDCIS